MRNHIALFVGGILVFLFCASRDLQAQEPVPAPLNRAFAGGGVGRGTDDHASRMRLANEGSSMLWFIEGGTRLTSRIGLGAEFTQTPVLTAATSGRSFNESGRQRERMAIGLLRARAAASERVAIDVVGGAGVLVQHHELRSAPCFSGCADARRESIDDRAPAFVLGADVPFRLGRHIGLSAITRYYALRRAERVSDTATLIPWQYETKPSARLAIGVSARASW
jgi:hypothetical protein